MKSKALLRALIGPIVREIVREEIASMQGLYAPVTEYTSRSLPPDVPSRERFHVLVKGAHGARKQGRVWRISVADWDAFRGATPPLAELEALADEAIRLAGFRPTR